MDGASTDRLKTAVARGALDITSASYEEAMRRHGIMPDAIKLISEDAQSIIAGLDEAHLDALAGKPEAIPADQRSGACCDELPNAEEAPPDK